MEMPKICNLPDFVKVAVISFAFIWSMNKVLDKAGLPQFKA